MPTKQIPVSDASSSGSRRTMLTTLPPNLQRRILPFLNLSSRASLRQCCTATYRSVESFEIDLLGTTPSRRRNDLQNAREEVVAATELKRWLTTIKAKSTDGSTSEDDFRIASGTPKLYRVKEGDFKDPPLFGDAIGDNAFSNRKYRYYDNGPKLMDGHILVLFSDYWYDFEAFDLNTGKAVEVGGLENGPNKYYVNTEEERVPLGLKHYDGRHGLLAAGLELCCSSSSNPHGPWSGPYLTVWDLLVNVDENRQATADKNIRLRLDLRKPLYEVCAVSVVAPDKCAVLLGKEQHGNNDDSDEKDAAVVLQWHRIPSNCNGKPPPPQGGDAVEYPWFPGSTTLLREDKVKQKAPSNGFSFMHSDGKGILVIISGEEVQFWHVGTMSLVRYCEPFQKEGIAFDLGFGPRIRVGNFTTHTIIRPKEQEYYQEGYEEELTRETRQAQVRMQQRQQQEQELFLPQHALPVNQIQNLQQPFAPPAGIGLLHPIHPVGGAGIFPPYYPPVQGNGMFNPLAPDQPAQHSQQQLQPQPLAHDGAAAQFQAAQQELHQASTQWQNAQQELLLASARLQIAQQQFHQSSVVLQSAQRQQALQAAMGAAAAAAEPQANSESDARAQNASSGGTSNESQPLAGSRNFDLVQCDVESILRHFAHENSAQEREFEQGICGILGDPRSGTLIKRSTQLPVGSCSPQLECVVRVAFTVHFRDRDSLNQIVVMDVEPFRHVRVRFCRCYGEDFHTEDYAHACLGRRGLWTEGRTQFSQPHPWPDEYPSCEQICVLDWRRGGVFDFPDHGESERDRAERYDALLENAQSDVERGRISTRTDEVIEEMESNRVPLSLSIDAHKLIVCTGYEVTIWPARLHYHAREQRTATSLQCCEDVLTLDNGGVTFPLESNTKPSYLARPFDKYLCYRWDTITSSVPGWNRDSASQTIDSQTIVRDIITSGPDVEKQLLRRGSYSMKISTAAFSWRYAVLVTLPASHDNGEHKLNIFDSLGDWARGAHSPFQNEHSAGTRQRNSSCSNISRKDGISVPLDSDDEYFDGYSSESGS